MKNDKTKTRLKLIKEYCPLVKARGCLYSEGRTWDLVDEMMLAKQDHRVLRNTLRSMSNEETTA